MRNKVSNALKLPDTNIEAAQIAQRIRKEWRGDEDEKWWVPDETRDKIISIKLTETESKLLADPRITNTTASDTCRLLVEGVLGLYHPPVPPKIREASLDPKHPKYSDSVWFVVTGIMYDSFLDKRLEELNAADKNRKEKLTHAFTFRVCPWHFEKLKEIARFLKFERSREEAGHVRVARLIVGNGLRLVYARVAAEGNA